MKIKLHIFATLCLLLFFTRSFAQDQDNHWFNDYIIGLKNDTVRCHLITFKGPDTNLFIKYRIAEGQRAKTISADSVRELFFNADSSIYVPRLLPKVGKYAFLELLEKGRLNLYRLIKAGSGSSLYVSTFLYANKGTDSLKQIKFISSSLFKYKETVGSRKDREQAFMDIIADNPDLLARFKQALKSADYSLQLIRYYVKTYNDEYLESHQQGK